MRKRYIQDRETGKFITHDEFNKKFYGDKKRNASHSILGELEEFVSPIDGSLIDDRSKLRAHNKRHGVTDMRDYGPDYFDRKGKERKAKAEGATRQEKMNRVKEILKSCNTLENLNRR